MPFLKECCFCSTLKCNNVSINTKVLNRHLLTTVTNISGLKVSPEQADSLLVCEECALASVQAEIITNKIQSLVNIYKSDKEDDENDTSFRKRKGSFNITNNDKPKIVRKRNFPCSYCNLRFTCAYNLKVHVTTHTGEPLPFACSADICNKRFASPAAAKIHELNRHTTEKPLSCHSCGKVFGSKDSLRKHMIWCSKLNKMFECGNCGKKFRIEERYDAHVESLKCFFNLFECQYSHCRKRFTNSNNLHRHMLFVHHETQ